MATERQRWVYKVVTTRIGFLGMKSDAIEDDMNKLGRDGWELVSVVQQIGQSGPTLFFKRPA
jgi:hypothetical protein